MVNNVSKKNLVEKANELLSVLKPEFFPYFARYLVCVFWGIRASVNLRYTLPFRFCFFLGGGKVTNRDSIWRTEFFPPLSFYNSRDIKCLPRNGSAPSDGCVEMLCARVRCVSRAAPEQGDECGCIACVLVRSALITMAAFVLVFV